MATFDIEQLSKKIEQVIDEHIAASERAATEAVSRAFGARLKRSSRASGSAARSAAPRNRRSTAELAAVGERLYEVVSRMPGESMVTLARELELNPRVLNRPMGQLRERGLVRSVGQKHMTRYFPLSPKS